MCCCCYDRCVERDRLWRYSIRRNAKIWLPVSTILMMLSLMGLGTYFSFNLVDEHLE